MVENQISAETLAKDHKEISVAEFFEKNKHLLGYENPQKSMLTCVKEAVENSLDACEESRILPDIFIEIKKIDEERFRITVEDNGPGIVKKNLPNVIGKLLYGSKFHRLRQGRGQQGIGISGAVLYSQLTTGRPIKIYSKIGGGKVHIYELLIDVRKNEPEIHSESEVYGAGHGTRIEMEIRGKYVKGRQSVPEYIKETAIMNPYAKITYVDPENSKMEYSRGINKLPIEPKEIQPHPTGVELGTLVRLLKETQSRNMIGFLTSEFSRISSEKAKEVCGVAGVESRVSPKSVTREEAEKIHNAMQKVKLQNPPTDCLSPIGEKAIEEGLKKELDPEFVAAITRSPIVYNGRPFQVEVGIAYGAKLTQSEEVAPITLMRFANKVPLLYDQSSCAVTKAVIQTDWRRYGLSQSVGALPVGPLAILVHIASVWVPYTSEGKTAIAAYPEILKEIKLALQDCGRYLQRHVSRKEKSEIEKRRREMFKNYAEEVADSISKLTGKKKDAILEKLLKIAKKMYSKLEAEEVETEKVVIIKEDGKKEKKREDKEELTKVIDDIFKRGDKE